MSPTEFRKLARTAMLSGDIKQLRRVGARWAATPEIRRRKILGKAETEVHRFLVGITAGIAVTAPGDLPMHFDGDGCRRCVYPGCRSAGHWGGECWEHNRWARDKVRRERERAERERKHLEERRKARAKR